MRKTIAILTIVLFILFMVGCENSVNPTNSDTSNLGLAKSDGETISLAKKGGKGNYSTFATIQEAIDNASSGDVITIEPGIYAEQVEIRDLNNLQLNGYGVSITVPAGGMTGSLVKIVNCENFKFDGFTIDGAEGVGVSYGAVNGGGDADTRFYGLFVINSSGQILNNVIQNVSWHTGSQQGLGVYVYVTDGVWRKINIRGNTVTNFQKGGLSVRGPIQSKIHKNIITHWGEIGIIAGNGIQVDGGTTSITNNDVGGSKYFDPILYPDWASTAILLIGWQESADNFRAMNNTVHDSDVGIWVIDYGVGNTNSKMINNTFYGNVWDGPFGPADMKAHANKYE